MRGKSGRAVVFSTIAIALLLLGAQSSLGLAIYDGFDYPAGNLGGNVNPSNGVPWVGTATDTNDIVVNPIGSLATPTNLPPGTGNEVQMLRSRNGADRLGLNSNESVVSTGALYYSLLIRVPDLGGLPSNTLGVFIAGFNNSVGTATSGITQAGARLHIRYGNNGTDTTHYQIGIRNDVVTGVGTSTPAFASQNIAPTDTAWVVAKYQFNSVSSTDDVASLWVNPDPLSFMNGNEPTPDATSTGGDINQLQIGSFFMFQRFHAQANAIAIDEVRISDTSDGIIPEPGAALAALVGGLSLARRPHRSKRRLFFGNRDRALDNAQFTSTTHHESARHAPIT